MWYLYKAMPCTHGLIQKPCVCQGTFFGCRISYFPQAQVLPDSLAVSELHNRIPGVHSEVAVTGCFCWMLINVREHVWSIVTEKCKWCIKKCMLMDSYTCQECLCLSLCFNCPVVWTTDYMPTIMCSLLGGGAFFLFRKSQNLEISFSFVTSEWVTS